MRRRNFIAELHQQKEEKAKEGEQLQKALEFLKQPPEGEDLDTDSVQTGGVKYKRSPCNNVPPKKRTRLGEMPRLSKGVFPPPAHKPAPAPRKMLSAKGPTRRSKRNEEKGTKTGNTSNP